MAAFYTVRARERERVETALIVLGSVIAMWLFRGAGFLLHREKSWGSMQILLEGPHTL
jgi:hypothetical protein